MYQTEPRQKLFSIIQSTARSIHDLYNFQVLNSAFGGAAGSTAVWGPIIPNGTGGSVNYYIQIASAGYASVYAFDVLGVYKSFDKNNWFVHTAFTGANHPNLSTASATKQNWSYLVNNMPSLYHRIQYVFRSTRRATSNGTIRPHIKVRGFAEVIDNT